MNIRRTCTGALIAFLIVFGCERAQREKPRPQVRLSPARDLTTEMFAGHMKDVAFNVVDMPGGGALRADYMEENRVDMSLVPADVAYVAFTNGTEAHASPHKTLRAVAAMNIVSTWQFVVGPGVKFQSISDLKGLRIAAGPQGSFAEQILRRILPQLGVPIDEVSLKPALEADLPELIATHAIDATFLLQIGTFEKDVIRKMLDVPGTRLASLNDDEITRLRDRNPFFQEVVIPAGTNGWKTDIRTVGAHTIWICRDDVDQDIVYRMLSVFFGSLRELAKAHPALEVVSLDEAPATPIPLHAGAARFYRERQIGIRQ